MPNLTGKTIGQLTTLTGITQDTLFPVELSGNTYNLPYSGLTQFNYEIGDYVSSEGGVIYHRYISGDSQYYLVVDTEDLGDYFLPFPYYIDWSNINSVASGAISLWNGENNTDLIINQVGCNSGAAYECSISNRSSKSDWYLPSSGEFIKMWSNIFEVSKGIEDASGTQIFLNYWTSTERDLDEVYYFDTVGGYSGLADKSSYNRVRMVRKFSI